MQDSNPPLYFQCHLCGECCSSWNIPVESHKAQQLLQKPWVRQRLTQARRALEPVSAEVYRIPLTDENICVFLGEDRRCLIEVNEGLTLKPHECQRFPFASVRFADGSVQHDTSAACKSVAEQLLLAFQPIQPRPPASPDSLAALQQREEDSFDPLETFPARIPIGFFRHLSLDQYHDSLSRITEIFSQADATPHAALRQAYHLLQQTHRPDAQPIKTLFHPVPLWKICFLQCFFLRKPYRTHSGISLLFNRTYHDPRLFGVPIPLSAQQRVAWNPEHNRLLNAFLLNILTRKRLLAGGSSMESLLAMAAVAGILVPWYACTLAWMQGDSVVTSQNVPDAIRLVERYYTGHQPRFMQWFSPRWRGWLLCRALLS